MFVTAVTIVGIDPAPVRGQAGDGAVKFPLQTRRSLAVYADLGWSARIRGDREYSLGLRVSWSCDRFLLWAGAHPIHWDEAARDRFGWEAGGLLKLLPGVVHSTPDRGPVTADFFVRAGSTTNLEVASTRTGVGVGLGSLVTIQLPAGIIPVPFLRNTDYHLVMAPRWDDIFGHRGFAFTIGLQLSRPDPPLRGWAAMWHSDRRRTRDARLERWSGGVSLARRWTRSAPEVFDPDWNTEERCFAF